MNFAVFTERFSLPASKLTVAYTAISPSLKPMPRPQVLFRSLFSKTPSLGTEAPYHWSSWGSAGSSLHYVSANAFVGRAIYCRDISTGRAVTVKREPGLSLQCSAYSGQILFFAKLAWPGREGRDMASIGPNQHALMNLLSAHSLRSFLFWVTAIGENASPE